MKANEMTRKDFIDLPITTKQGEVPRTFGSLVLIPSDRLHDSGWQCINLVFLDSNMEPICKVETYTDVIHLDGIGGYGKGNSISLVKAKGWCIDCLPCGYMRLFPSSQYTLFGDDMILSSYCVYAERKDDEDGT